MTDQLQSIRERFAAIIPGPWDWYGNTATDQVYLATPNRGRLIILTPALREKQYVYDHDELESYPLEEARQRAPQLWCPLHRQEPEGRDSADKCCCDAMASWLRGEVEQYEGSRYFTAAFDGAPDELDGQLIRGVSVHADLRFADESTGERRNEHGGMLRSYRRDVRYEVLDYRTATEWEMDQGNVKDSLYREDFKGIATPEADFIAHAPEDIGYLLEKLDAAHAIIDDLSRRLAAAHGGGQ